jgi:hypothetical protein
LETEAKAKVEDVLQKGLRLAPSGSGSVQHAVRLGRSTDGKRPWPILVKCKSSSSAGEILRSRSSLKDSNFARAYLNPHRTPEERARVSQAVREMKNKDNSVQAFVTMQGVLVVQLEKGQQERKVFELQRLHGQQRLQPPAQRCGRGYMGSGHTEGCREEDG